MPDLTEVAADLYGVPPAEFTAARTAAGAAETREIDCAGVVAVASR